MSRKKEATAKQTTHRHPYPGRTAWDGHSFPI